MSVGYSGKPIAGKLGIKEGFRVAILNAPNDYEDKLGPILKRVTLSRRMDGHFDLIQIFATDESTLQRQFRASKGAIRQDGAIWVSWPKRSSGLQGDLGESEVRETGLKNGFVDVKICAIDETWSALKFVTRSRDRK